jgi:hypothetical protein
LVLCGEEKKSTQRNNNKNPLLTSLSDSKKRGSEADDLWLLFGDECI